jgi:sec-independent protein translocase protein TatC
MFDISFTEMILIAVVALVVIGPERLPKVARAAGHLLGRVQRYVSDVKSDISREMQLDELKKLRAEIQDSARSVEQSLSSEMQAARQAMTQTAQAVSGDASTPAAANTQPSIARPSRRSRPWQAPPRQQRMRPAAPKNRPEQSDQTMSEETGDSFLSHLVELRDRLIRALIAIGVVFLCLFPWAKELYSLLAQPLLEKLPQGGQMIATDVIGVFLVPMKVALMVAFLIALPYVLYQIWAFIAPGLYAHEKKLALPLVGVSVFLFFVGMAFAYFLVFPTVFGFMAKVAPEGVAWMTDIEKYLSFVMTTFMAFGVTFEVPVLVVVLVYANIVDLAKLKEWRPYVIVGSFVVAAVLTPPDVISQLLMAIPMCLLFELGLALARFVTKRSARQERPYDQEAAAAAESDWKALSADEMNKAVADLHTQAGRDQKPDA